MSTYTSMTDTTTAEAQQETGDEDEQSESPRIAQLYETVQELQADVEDATRKANHAQDRVLTLRQENRELRQELEQAEQERDELRQEIAEIDDRTDLLETVKRAGGMKVEHRAAVCIQTLYNEARKRQQKQTKDGATASMDYNKAGGALGGAVSRDQIYRTFDRAEELVGDTDVVEYIKEDRTSAKNSRLVLSLEGGDVPTTVAGHHIEEREV